MKSALLLLAFSFYSMPIAAQAPAAQDSAVRGMAVVSLIGKGVSVTGEYPAKTCGGAYMLGAGMAYQVKAGDWQITVASETRETGRISLNESDGSVRVIATANGPGRQFVRKPRLGGSFVVSDDYKQAEAKLDLRNVAGHERAELEVSFRCR